MKPINLTRRQNFVVLKFIAAIACLVLVTACGAQKEEQQPAPKATLQPIATMTPVPSPTAAPTETNTPVPPTAPTDTPAATATPIPTPIPTDTPAPPAPPTEEPTETRVPLMQVTDARAIYHDAEVLNNVANYPSEVQPWLDLLVRLDDTWYGPERYEDDIQASPLPEGYRWEVDGGFSSLPNGEVWWTGPSVEGNARLIGPDGSELYALKLQIDFY